MSISKLSSSRREREPIAIVGIGCRFPGGANDAESYWRLLSAGADAITEIPEDRWSIERYYHPRPGVPGKTYARWGGFIEGIDQFDPEFFGISPREAAHMDPQQRLLLEVAWEALEDGGQIVERLAGTNTGVFVGISTFDYAQLQSSLRDIRSVDPHFATGGASSIAANRISYCLSLHGPSVAVDTACSSSLVATHLACQSIWNEECSQALAGGVNIIISPGPFIAFCAASMLSPDGRCKAFDAGANGFVRGEGAGVIVLKPLAKARADGDPVYAVIVSSAVNQDGRTAGIAAPSQEAQQNLLRQVCEEAGIAFREVDYVEAHGTGTAAGDPVEAGAIGNVFSSGRPKGQYCVMGSVKTNIGHLEAAAGIAGLIKLALCLKHRMIPPNLHFLNPNPRISFEELQLRVPTSLEPWPQDSKPAVGGVNSFGFGGTNAHLLLTEHRTDEEASAPVTVTEQEDVALLPLSARTPEALECVARSYLEFLRRDGGVHLRDLCYTAGVHRTHFDHRLSVAGHTERGLSECLEAFLGGAKRPGMTIGRRMHGQVPRPVFVFCGQGPQWWGMGRELLRSEPVFREAVEECDALLGKYADWSLIDELRADEADSRLHETAIAQPALFSLQVALTALWKSWGVQPEAVIGHSVGEVAAAYVAGALNLESAARVIFHRGRCMDFTAAKGRMLAVGLSMAGAEEAIRDFAEQVSIAAINSPSSAVLSGDSQALEQISLSLTRQGVFCRFLRVQYAFHSPQMDSIKAELLESLEGIESQDPVIPIVSTVTGKPVEGLPFENHYWWRNVREKVLFGDAVTWLIQRDHDLYLELGPHPVLSVSIAECLQHLGRKGTVLPSLQREQEEKLIMLGSLGALYTLGYPVDWKRLWSTPGRYVHLPKYPWQRQAYWHEPEASKELRLEGKRSPLLDRDEKSADPTWEISVDKRSLPYLEDHKLQGNVVVPAAAYVEMALEAAQEVLGAGACVLEEIQFQQRLLVPDPGEAPRVKLVFYSADESLAIYSRPFQRHAWVRNAVGTIRKEEHARPVPNVDLETIRKELPDEIHAADCYERFSALGLRFGPSFQSVERIWRRDGEALGLLRLHGDLEREDKKYCFHPALLDSCFQVFIGAVPQNNREIPATLYLPVRIDRLRFYKSPETQVLSHVRISDISPTTLEGDVRVYGEDGTLLLEIDGFRCQTVGRVDGKESDGVEDWFYEVQWQSKPVPEEKPARPSGDYIPRSREIAAAVERDIHLAADEIGWSRVFAAAAEQLDRVAAAYVVKTLRGLGWGLSAGEHIRLESLARRVSLKAHRRGAIQRIAQILEQAGYVKRAGAEEWVVWQAPPELDPEKLWDETLSQYPAYLAELWLIGKWGSSLAALLGGETDPYQVIAPQGSAGLVEHFYQDSPFYRLYNMSIQQTVARAVGSLPKGRIARILEIGGAAGETAVHVLASLPLNRVEYVFSDFADTFFDRAQQKLRNYAGVKFQLLDVEKDPACQNYELHSFDLILASGVLHAAGELSDALENIRKLLSSEGLLVLLEPENGRPWVELVFGLSGERRKFRDFALEPGCHLLAPAVWKNSLERAGFADIERISVSPFGEDLQVLLLARAAHIHAETPGSAAGEDLSEIKGEAGTWLVFADRGGLTRNLKELLKSRGEKAILVTAGEDFCRLDDGSFQIAPDRPESMERLIRFVAESYGAEWRGAIHLWSLDESMIGTTPLESARFGETFGCQCILYFLRALSMKGRRDKSFRLLLVTRGAQPVENTIEAAALGQAPLIGLGRVVANEFPEIRCKMVDLARTPSPEDTKVLFKELHSEDPEEEVAWREGIRWVPRINRASRKKVAVGKSRDGADRAFRVEISASGAMEHLSLRETLRQAPGPGQVEIKVCAASLNFRDVMKALGLYPGDGLDSVTLGDECAGTVVALGEGVNELRVGDEVVAVAPGSFGSYATARAELVMKKPAGLSFEEAATMPVAFLTAYYSLHHLAHLSPGETVLIHAAAGGVGLAALQVARGVGAEIIATAGSPEKRELLGWLGISHILDSRSLSFAEQVMEITAGRGVDVVLNSLGGAAIAKGLSCMAPYGRFVELGKRDIYQNSKLGMWAFRKNGAFFAVDMSGLMSQKPGLARSLFCELSERIQEKSFRPLPHRVYPVSRIGDAFRLMAQAKHFGKVVVSLLEKGLTVDPLDEKPISFRPDATYLITGGFGGFGLTVGKWIVEKGGRNVVLMGRSGAASEGAKKDVEDLKKAGARVVVARADISSDKQVAKAIADIEQTMPPLRGIFHAAMVLDDGVLLQLSPERFRNVLSPKVDGTWFLHSQTLHRPLDFFVLFSSVSSLIGSRGQANYVAANAFLDAFAYYRRSLGLPAVTVNWGQLAETGYASRNRQIGEFLTRRGIKGILPRQAMHALSLVLERNPVQIGVMRINQHKLAQSLLQGRPPQKLMALLGEHDVQERIEEGARIREAVLQAEPAKRESILQSYVSEQVANVLGTSAAKLDFDQPLSELGFDSLMAVELKNRLENDLVISLPPGKLMQGPSIRRLSAEVMELLKTDGEIASEALAPEVFQELEPVTRPSPACLVPLRASEARPPLFCIHPAGGQISIYKDLVERLPPGQAVYGIESRHLDGSNENHHSIEELAREYARLIAREQLPGPYCLLGFSLGGFIAMAMASVLEGWGREVAFVGLVDCDLKWADPSPSKELLLRNLIIEMYGLIYRESGAVQSLETKRLLDEAAKLSAEILSSSGEQRIEAIIGWLMEREYTFKDIPRAILKEYLASFDNHITLIADFHPRMIQAPLILWWARDSLSALDGSKWHWGQYTTSEMIERTIEGNHYSVMYPPAVAALAEELDKRLRAFRGS
ncbi:MAG: SDR family NAD(P)-dependent oxidoreductase [Deltaproteobacteria bacterium]|nr:SDR family NAD(P)-dependent oxidoreductase [Deltaproteobacteria bacterium]